MQINRMGARDEVFLQARKYTSPPEVTQQGVDEAKDLSAQYGSSRKIVAFGDHAIAFKENVFSELEAKFGKAKPLDDGAFAFGKEGSDYIASWHGTVLNDLGYAAADKNEDGIITNREARGVKTMIDFDGAGQVFLRQPRRGDLPNDDHQFKTVQDQLNRVVSDDKDKNGVISTAEVKQGETGFDIDDDRRMAMAARGQNPDGSFSTMEMNGFTVESRGLDTSSEKTPHAVNIHGKLRRLEAQIRELRSQGADDSDEKLKELQAAEKLALAELKQSGEHQPVDVKA